MKTILVACGLLCCGALAAGAADPSPSPLEKTPLPPGPWIHRMPAYSSWRVLFTYATDKPPAKPGSTEKPPAADKISDDATLPPRTVVITRTQPVYHVALIDTGGRVSELWFDGNATYMLTPGHPAPSLPGLGQGGVPEIPAYLNYSRVDFQDIEWVSAQTYLGTLKQETATYLVFRQGDKGPTVWIDADTRLPAQWQNAGETRKFEYFAAPTEPLTLPAAVMQSSRVIHRMQEITNHRPPRGS